MKRCCLMRLWLAHPFSSFPPFSSSSPPSSSHCSISHSISHLPLPFLCFAAITNAPRRQPSQWAWQHALHYASFWNYIGICEVRNKTGHHHDPSLLLRRKNHFTRVTNPHLWCILVSLKDSCNHWVVSRACMNRQLEKDRVTAIEACSPVKIIEPY